MSVGLSLPARAFPARYVCHGNSNVRVYCDSPSQSTRHRRSASVNVTFCSVLFRTVFRTEMNVSCSNNQNARQCRSSVAGTVTWTWWEQHEFKSARLTTIHININQAQINQPSDEPQLTASVSPMIFNRIGSARHNSSTESHAATNRNGHGAGVNNAQSTSWFMSREETPMSGFALSYAATRHFLTRAQTKQCS